MHTRLAVPAGDDRSSGFAGGDRRLSTCGRFVPSPADLDRLRDVWSGRASDTIAETMVTGTAAVALKAMGRATGQDEAQVLAETFWHERDKGALRGAA